MKYAERLYKKKCTTSPAGLEETFVVESVIMRVVKSLLLALVFISLTTVLHSSECGTYQRRKPDRRYPPKHYNYPDKHDYGFDPVPPSIRIAPGFRDNHHWRIGGWYYGQGDYSPGYDGMLWFGYEIEY